MFVVDKDLQKYYEEHPNTSLAKYIEHIYTQRRIELDRIEKERLDKLAIINFLEGKCFLIKYENEDLSIIDWTTSEIKKIDISRNCKDSNYSSFLVEINSNNYFNIPITEHNIEVITENQYNFYINAMKILFPNYYKDNE